MSAISFFAISATAQNIDTTPILKKELKFRQVPAAFTSNGECQVWILEDFDRDKGEGIITLIDEDLNEKKKLEFEKSCEMYFWDLSQPYEVDMSFYACQTLFNTDDKYEYVSPIISVVEFSWGTREYMTGFKIVSDGTVIQTINFPQGLRAYYHEMNIIKIGTKLYLNVEEVQDSNGEYYELLYKIDRAANSISMVRQDYVGKTRKVYNHGRILIKNEEGKLYTPDGVEVNRE